MVIYPDVYTCHVIANAKLADRYPRQIARLYEMVSSIQVANYR